MVVDKGLIAELIDEGGELLGENVSESPVGYGNLVPNSLLFEVIKRLVNSLTVLLDNLEW